MSFSYFPRILCLAITVIVICVPCQCLKDNNLVCVKINPCQCVFQVGVGIDLTDLQATTSARLPWIETPTANQTFYFQPCYNAPFTGDTDSECGVGGAALCVYNKVLKTYKLLGKIEDGSFDSTSPSDPVQLKYNHNNISTTITLECGVGTDPTSLAYDSATSSDTSYKFTLKSQSVCLREMDPRLIVGLVESSLSTGSVLVIIFFTFTIIYFAAGALALKLMRGAEGKELIPNYDFWSDLPLLVKDGACFVMSGFQTVASYDRI